MLNSGRNFAIQLLYVLMNMNSLPTLNPPLIYFFLKNYGNQSGIGGKSLLVLKIKIVITIIVLTMIVTTMIAKSKILFNGKQAIMLDYCRWLYPLK